MRGTANSVIGLAPMVLRRVFRYLAEKWVGFRKWLRCGAIECVDNYEYRCRLGSADELARCILAVSVVEGEGGLSHGEAEELRKACYHEAGQLYNKCIEIYKECCDG